MSWEEFFKRGLTEDMSFIRTNLNEDPRWDMGGAEKRMWVYRNSHKYKRTALECLRLDLKVLFRVAKRKFRRG